MSLSDKQAEFLWHAAKLIIFAHDKGYKVTGGELQRTPYQQAEYLRTGKSKTMKSDHLRKCAIDLNIFWEGKPLWNFPEEKQREVVKPLADYWHSLHPKNYCGYDWNWDLPHFGRA